MNNNHNLFHLKILIFIKFFLLFIISIDDWIAHNKPIEFKSLTLKAKPKFYRYNHNNLYQSYNLNKIKNQKNAKKI